MPTNKYICNECYKIYGEEDTRACKCEVDIDSRPPIVCIMSATGLVRWKCTHDNMKLSKLKDVLMTSDGSWWGIEIYQCCGCSHETQGVTRKFKITPVVE